MDKFKLLYKNKVVISKGNFKCEDKYIATIISNIANLGYTLSLELIDVLRTNDTEYVIDFYKELVLALKEEIGYKKYNPMYPNFPEQLASISDFELFIDAYVHFITRGERLPYYEKEERFPLMDNVSYKVLQLGTIDDYKVNFNNILNSKTSISDRNKEYITWFIKSHFNLALESMPEVIPFKENMCIVVSLLYSKKVNEKIVCSYVKTATDVLRIATYMSEGDATLAGRCRYKSFTRRERRFLLALLENIPNKLEDMYCKKGKWIRLGERLHPGDFAEKYPLTYKDFTILRENGKVETFNSKVKYLLDNKEVIKAIDLLSTRPGQLARKLDEILRLDIDDKTTAYLINAFDNVANKIESTVLWQVREHFNRRCEKKSIRAFFPKGLVSKMYVKENDLKELSKSLCVTFTKICERALKDKYAEKEKMGNVYIAPELRKYLIPFNQRSSSKSLKTITRGSRVSISEDTSVIRAFIHWKDAAADKGCGGTDLDLTASIMKEDLSNIADIGYYNLKEKKLNCYHSGDVRFAPKGGSEFIDIDIDSLISVGARYVTFSVNSYSQEEFVDIPQCFFGFMERQKINSGEIYEPKTVNNKYDLTSDSTMVVTMILDLVNREFIWVDSAFKRKVHLPNNVFNNASGVVALTKVMAELQKPNMYDLFTINAEARGSIVERIEDADIAFVVEKTLDEDKKTIEITPYDIEEIIGDFL